MPVKIMPPFKVKLNYYVACYASWQSKLGISSTISSRSTTPQDGRGPGRAHLANGPWEGAETVARWQNHGTQNTRATQCPRDPVSATSNWNRVQFTYLGKRDGTSKKRVHFQIRLWIGKGETELAKANTVNRNLYICFEKGSFRGILLMRTHRNVCSAHCILVHTCLICHICIYLVWSQGNLWSPSFLLLFNVWIVLLLIPQTHLWVSAHILV